MLTADAHFQVRPGLATFIDSDLHQATYPFPVDGLEWVLGQDPFGHVGDQEVAFGIIPAVAKGHLGQVIGTEGEELCQFCQFTGSDSRPWDFDHRPEFISKVYFLLFHDSLGNAHQARLDPFELLDCTCQRDHDLGMDHDLA